MSTWLIPRGDLTPEQLRAIELGPEEHRLILGGPGSGKTQILLHRAQYLREALHVPDDRLQVFVYTKALRAYIESALPMLDLPRTSVSTLDSWCMNYFRDHFRMTPPRDAESRQPDFAAVRRTVLAHLQTRTYKPFDFVLVDEGQDLDGVAFEILKASSHHVTVCADHKQQIYDNGCEIRDMLTWLQIRRSNISLLETYRCCPYVVHLAAQLVDDVTERERYLRQVRTAQVERETPLLYRARDAEDEKQHMLEVVRTRLSKGERIAVLFPQQRFAYGYATGFKEAGIDVENPKELDFKTDRPKFMPYHSAKGLTFDTVILPRMVPYAFGKMPPELVRRIVFVGITRATRWVYVSTIAGKTFDPVERLEGAANEGSLSIRDADSAHSGPSATSAFNDDDPLDLL